MKTRRIITTLMFLAIAGIVVSASGVYATPVSQGDSVKIELQYTYPRYSNGGPFQITDLNNGSKFMSFCVETDEYFTDGGTYFVGSITTGAIHGGGGPLDPDPLDSRTAYLYYNFLQGKYSTNDADDIQQVIWYIEEEITSLTTTRAQELLTEANNKAETSLWGVQVLNIYGKDANGNYSVAKQDQLVYVPEPGTLLFLGVTLVGISLAARRRRRSA